MAVNPNYRPTLVWAGDSLVWAGRTLQWAPVVESMALGESISVKADRGRALEVKADRGRDLKVLQGHRR